MLPQVSIHSSERDVFHKILKYCLLFLSSSQMNKRHSGKISAVWVAPLQKAKEKYHDGWVFEGKWRSSFANQQAVFACGVLGCLRRGLCLFHRGFPASWAPALGWSAGAGRTTGWKVEPRLLKGPSRAGAALTGSQDLQTHWNSFHQKQDQERGEVHQLLPLASGCYRTHTPQPPLLLPRLPVHQGGSKLPSSLKHQKLWKPS